MPSLDDRVGIAVAHRDHVLFSEVFSRTASQADLKVDWRFVRAEGEIGVDVFAGELRWAGHLSARLPWRRWHRVLDVDHGVFARFVPAVGEIGGSPDVAEPTVRHPRFGHSQLCTPAVLRIFVDDGKREIAEVGRLVKQRLFGDRPAFTFNTVCCVGGVPDGAPGLYPNPDSIWFNVFFGFYQLDCPKAEWSRPFGYRSAAGLGSEIEPEDVVRLGKADWNWFSNWMYGVPDAFLEPYSSPDMKGIEVTDSPPKRIGSRLWHGLTLSGVEVASAYESDAQGAARLGTNTVAQDVWRHAFGLPSPRPDHAMSFVPTRLVAQMDMAYWEDSEAFHTVIFGGTAGLDAEPGFLATQMAAVEAVIEKTYAELGFEPA